MKLTSFAFGVLVLLCAVCQEQVHVEGHVFSSRNGRLYVNDDLFQLKGVAWFGFETGNRVLHGLWSISMDSGLDFIQRNKFNALRVPFAANLPLDASLMPNSINFQVNPDLQGLTAIQVMDVLVQKAAQRGLLVMFDQHVLTPETGIGELWYSSSFPENKVLDSWSVIVNRYKNAWNVFACDLKNEPHGVASLGDGNINTDWRLAAQRIGNHILTLNPNLLIFVEGVERNSVNPSQYNCWWGGCIQGFVSAPVSLLDNTKLVYSPHVYGPDVYMQPYFSDAMFPQNMPVIWTNQFGGVPAATGNAVVIGEWGGKYRNSDKTWQDAMANYLIQNGLNSQFYWCFNPNSGDTEGLVQGDWVTPVQPKLDLLAKVQPNPTLFSGQGVIIDVGSNNPGNNNNNTTNNSTCPVLPPYNTVYTNGTYTCSCNCVSNATMGSCNNSTTNPPPTNPPPTNTSNTSNVINPFTNVVVNVKETNNWSSGSSTSRQYDVRIINNDATKTLKSIVLVPQSFQLQQGWSLEFNTNSITFPAWVIQNGGLLRGQTLDAGFIATDPKPVFTVTDAIFV